ncbi:MAG TPA: DUF5130 family protein [Streptosporangiaceae bacterium]|jgi:hypothetical protein
MNGNLSRAFTDQQEYELGRLVDRAREETGLTFSVYVGSTPEGVKPREEAVRLLGEFGDEAPRVVLIYVDPNARALEIVTGPVASGWLDERTCGLAAVNMTSSFALGDLPGGIQNGIEQMVGHVTALRSDR